MLPPVSAAACSSRFYRLPACREAPVRAGESLEDARPVAIAAIAPGVSRGLVAAPGHVKIGPHQQEVISVNVARRLICNFEHVQRCPCCPQRSLQVRGIRMRSAKAQQRVASAQTIMQRRAVVQPNVGQPRPWPGRRNIVGIVRIGAVAGLGPDRRAIRRTGSQPRFPKFPLPCVVRHRNAAPSRRELRSLPGYSCRMLG